jgi:solute carrier family 25 carnitine/acylcarnitine transporter 20/29
VCTVVKHIDSHIDARRAANPAIVCANIACTMLQQYKETVAGAGAGLVGTVIGYPLDVIKGRMQAQPGSSMLRTARSIFTEQSITGFYRGVVPPLLSLTILNMTNFSSYAAVSKAITPVESASVNCSAFVAGAAVGPIAALISTPFELLKIQMQFSIKNRTGYKSTSDAAFHIYKTRGLSALYRGHIVNSLREMLFLGTYFFCYENLKQAILDLASPSLAIPLAGGMSGSIGWLVSFPLDCVKTNIQSINMDPKSYTSLPKSSTIETFLEILRTRGILNLYNGVAPSIVRAFIVSSSRFSAYEAIMSIISRTSLNQ